MKTQTPYYDDNELLTGIRNKNTDVIRYIYQNLKPIIQRFIVKNSGDEIITEDIFQETLIVVFNKLRKEDLCLTCSFNTYFIAICKKIWYNYLRKRSYNFIDFTNDVENFNFQEKSYELNSTPEFTRLFFKHFNKMSPKSREVLILYFNNVPADVIATRLGFKNKEYAISRKYKCLKRLVTSIKSDPKLNDIAIEDEKIELF